jgi:hypothetical protein
MVLILNDLFGDVDWVGDDRGEYRDRDGGQGGRDQDRGDGRAVAWRWSVVSVLPFST